MENTRVRSTSKAREDRDTKKTDRKRILNIECRILNFEFRRKKENIEYRDMNTESSRSEQSPDIHPLVIPVKAGIH
jgi:hypothetical protein